LEDKSTLEHQQRVLKFGEDHYTYISICYKGTNGIQKYLSL